MQEIFSDECSRNDAICDSMIQKIVQAYEALKRIGAFSKITYRKGKETVKFYDTSDRE
ncbi:MAG: hypothetical protein HUJ74_02395 [Lachnospiraceae bacterium]|nr:hypothetical protein [Lachnospiraceae bacterium]